MLIQSLTLRNFKSFGANANPTDDEITSFSGINMLFGYNNSGKSNLLKFLITLFQSKSSQESYSVEGEGVIVKPDDDVYFWKGSISNAQFIFHKNNRNVPIEFEISVKVFHQELKDAGYASYDALAETYFSSTHDYFTLNLTGEIRKIDDFDTAEMVLKSATLNSTSIYSLDGNGRAQYFTETPQSTTKKGKGESASLMNDGLAFNGLMGIFKDCTLFLDNNRYLATEIMANGSETHELSPANYKNWLHKLYLDPRTNGMFEELSQFIRGNKINPIEADEAGFKYVESFSSPLGAFKPEFARIGDNIELMFKVGDKRLPLSSFGTGVQQLLYILTTLFTTNAKLILIEELELNLSPRYQSALFKILNALIAEKRISQVFFTTHSKYFRFRNDFSVYEIGLDSTGKSQISKVESARVDTFFAERLDD